MLKTRVMSKRIISVVLSVLMLASMAVLPAVPITVEARTLETIAARTAHPGISRIAKSLMIRS